MKRRSEENRNARDFVEEFQKRIYSLTRSSIASGVYEPEQIEGYRIIRKLGSGGSAVVYLVEAEDGQKAALKLLKGIAADSYSRQRFDSERQILSKLDHPNIARLIEGGITETGIPYVITEFVDGLPVDEWCDRNQLDISDRIRLFQKVCHAVHYAHQNLVVHRDIKPEHVLVTETGEIKLIDFGIARLLEPEHPEPATLRTRTGMRIMTPEFASPEQVRGEPVTTASDIYSLGVLLYVLLTGRRPYSFKTTSMLEIERLVCGQEPVKPSSLFHPGKPDTKLAGAGTGKNTPETARLRGVSPARLRKLLSGDPDRIVLMAMRKEPEYRYSSAQSFADDLENYLRGEPVTARAPAFGYLARKFISRHKWAVTAAAIAVLALAGGTIGTLWQARQAQLNAQRAETQAQIAGQVTDFLVDLFESGDPNVTHGAGITIEELLERGVEQALEPGQDSDVQLNLLLVLGRVYNGMGIYDKSAELYEAALRKAEAQNPPDPLLMADLQAGLGLNMRLMGNLTAADSLYLLALEHRRSTLGEFHPLTVESMDEWAGIHAYLARDAELADSLFRDVVNRKRRVLDPDDEKLAESLNNLAYIKTTKGEYHEALRYYEESAEIYRVSSGENHPDRLRSLSGAAVANHRIGNLGRAEQMFYDLIERRTTVLGENHPQVAISYYHLAGVLKETGRLGPALTAVQKSVGIMEKLEAPHQFFPDILFSLAVILAESGDTGSAAEIYHRTAQTCREIRGPDSPGCTRMYRQIGEFFLEQKMNSEARLYLQYAYEDLSRRSEPGDEQLAELDRLIRSAM